MKKLVVAALLCNAFHGANASGEVILHFTDSVTPVWQETAGFYLEVSGKFVQTSPGKASVVMRLLDNARPVTITHDSAEGGGWALAKQDDLPHDFMEGERPREPQTVTWRIQVRRLQHPVQKIMLSELRAGRWETMISQDVALKNLREWVENPVVTFGIAGPMVLESPRTRMIRESSLILIR